MTDLDDTTGCPVGGFCEGCDAGTGLMAGTASTAAGVYCFTWCGFCAEEGIPPYPVSRQGDLLIGGAPGAVLRAAAHCEHLGIDADEMGRLLDRQGGRSVTDGDGPPPPGRLAAVMSRPIGDPAAQARFERLVRGEHPDPT